MMLYHPKTREIVARYDHHEVIVERVRSGDRLLLTDFNGQGVVLSLRDHLRPLAT